jgi:hypothetical protein
LEELLLLLGVDKVEDDDATVVVEAEAEAGTVLEGANGSEKKGEYSEVVGEVVEEEAEILARVAL